MKVYKGGQESLDPPPEGWAVIIFADGYQATCAGAKVVSREGEPWVQMYLRPEPAILKKFEINVGSLDKNGFRYEWYPKDMVIPLNTYDPSRRIFFCLLNYGGKETESTDYFLGKAQIEEVSRLRQERRQMKVHIAMLKEENLILKSNVKKYIADSAEGILGPVMPFVKSLIPELNKEGEHTTHHGN